MNQRTERGASLLQLAGVKGLPRVARLLISYGAELNSTDQEGRTALYYTERSLRDLRSFVDKRRIAEVVDILKGNDRACKKIA